MDGQLSGQLPLRYTHLRWFLVAIIATALLANGLAAAGHDPATLAPAKAAPSPSGKWTVITTQQGGMYGYAGNGSREYTDHRMDTYWDVDPLPNRTHTVLYTAAKTIGDERCKERESCSLLVVERANLTTGEVTRLFADVRQKRGPSRWHDIDRLGPHRWAVADIGEDEAYVYNHTSGLIEWGWDADFTYPETSGGATSTDWTHLNDIEAINDSTYMLSLRNHDQVVFVHRQFGIIEGLTLGDDNDHEKLFEQHNPDYIPVERGGPAVIVSDSENNRVIEYQRTDGEWRETWIWRDSTLSWPRDADRLPNGHTLITDTHGDRVIEVNRYGDVVWSVTIDGGYEAERLGTADESAGGESASRLGLQSRQSTGGGSDESPSMERRLKALAPPKLVHGLMHATPIWMGVFEFAAAAFGVAALLSLLGIEAYRSPYKLRTPVYKQRK